MPDLEKHGFGTTCGAVYVASRLIADTDQIFSPGAVVVSDGKVLMVGCKSDVLGSVPASFTVREFPGAVMLPGLVNAHTHLQIPRDIDGGKHGDRRPEDFTGWLLQMIRWRLRSDPSTFSRIFRRGAEEALSFGTTTVGEIAGPDISCYESCQLRARVFVEGIGFSPEAAPVQQEAIREIVLRLEKISKDNPLVFSGLSPHTLYTVGEELLRRLVILYKVMSLPVCLHLAESKAEIEFLEHGRGEFATRLYPEVGQDVSWFCGIGMPIPTYLEKMGLLRKGLLLVHNVHLSTEEINVLNEGGARFVLCPRSNRAHGNGVPDVTHFVDSGIPFAIGTDSLGSVDDLNLWQEIRYVRSLYEGRLRENELCGVLMRAATVNGAAALSLPGGSLFTGAPADFVLVDDPGGDDAGIYRRLLDRTERANVRMTVVAGLVAHGKGA